MKSELFKRFTQINKEYLCTDKHVHTTWVDGKSSIDDIVKKAEQLGLIQIGFTEHIRADSTYFSGYLKEIKNKKLRNNNVDLLVGFEAKIMNFEGDIDAPKDALKSAEVKMASVHRFTFGRKLIDPKELIKKACQQVELELSIAAIKKRECNVLGHAGGMSLKTYNEFPLEFFEEIIVECRKNDVAFDLNSFYHMPVVNELKKLLMNYDPYVSIGSDAHHADELGAWINSWIF